MNAWPCHCRREVEVSVDTQSINITDVTKCHRVLQCRRRRGRGCGCSERFSFLCFLVKQQYMLLVHMARKDVSNSNCVRCYKCTDVTLVLEHPSTGDVIMGLRSLEIGDASLTVSPIASASDSNRPGNV